ncbi:type IV pilus secretin PilQ [Kushneria aurantia]|uniref:Type IV pilus secretin PilQ n=1 Tax=Kushneria aurantia TaxID=504092 RepID=A0ABV6FZD4_9GAMM|nr:type IV pilus secretin PilQ [Kushneria aurantia]
MSLPKPMRVARCGLILLLTVLLMALSLAAGARSLTDIAVSEGSRGAMVQLTFDTPVSEPQAVALTAPPRLVLDFPAADSQLMTAPGALAGAGIASIDVADSGDRLRVTLALARPMGWQIDADGRVIRLALDGGAQAATAMAAEGFFDSVATGAAGAMSADNGSSARSRSAGATTVNSRVSPVSGASSGAGSLVEVNDIDFRITGDGSGELLVGLGRDGISPQLDVDSGRATLRLANVRLPPQWRRILDVSDFATPLSRVIPEQQGSDTLMTLVFAPGAVLSATQRGRQVAVEVSPAGSDQAREQREQFPFGGQRVSLNFQRIDVRGALSILAEEVGLNLVVSDAVGGNVTLNLQDVPWDQALELILQSSGLASRRSGNVLMVAPGDELAAMAQRRAEAEQGVANNETLTTDYLRMRYARAADLATLLRGENGLGLLSERGHISVDERTNTLVVQDTRARIEAIRRTIDQLDIPVRQVQIEARIVIARERAASELGVRWGATSTNQVDTGSRSVNDNASGRGRAFGGLAVDYGDGEAANTTFGIGYLSSDVLLNLTLNALESEGDSQTISQPRVITANQRPALIEQGQEIPYQEGSDDALTGTSVEFKEALLSLQVTPQITPDNRIIMDLVIQNDDVSSTQYNGVPAIDTNRIETQVLVNNGETVVLGGILSSEQVNNLSKTPLLGDLPGIGRLFRYTERSNEKVELLVFITPRILEDTLTVR